MSQIPYETSYEGGLNIYVELNRTQNYSIPLKPTINEFAMIHSHATHTAYKLEVRQVVFVGQARLRVDLQGVVITARQMA